MRSYCTSIRYKLMRVLHVLVGGSRARRCVRKTRSYNRRYAVVSDACNQQRPHVGIFKHIHLDTYCFPLEDWQNLPVAGSFPKPCMALTLVEVYVLRLETTYHYVLPVRISWRIATAENVHTTVVRKNRQKSDCWQTTWLQVMYYQYSSREGLHQQWTCRDAAWGQAPRYLKTDLAMGNIVYNTTTSIYVEHS